jgi:hypothetical protein
MPPAGAVAVALAEVEPIAPPAMAVVVGAQVAEAVGDALAAPLPLPAAPVGWAEALAAALW